MTPEERDIVRDFLNGLAQEEEGVSRNLASDRLGMAFRTAINELDWYVWNYAWSLRSVRLDSYTSFATWNQLVNTVMLMERRQGDFCTLGGLHSLLRTYIVDAPDRYHRDQAPVEYVLNGLKFAVIQTHADEPARVAAEACGS